MVAIIAYRADPNSYLHLSRLNLPSRVTLKKASVNLDRPVEGQLSLRLHNIRGPRTSDYRRASAMSPPSIIP
jgi:hypothetical protein